MKNLLIFTLLTFFEVALHAQTVSLENFATGFDSPLSIQNAGDERLFIVEQGGVIKIVNPDGSTNPTPFLDIQSIVLSGGERGLLGMAFHPDYQNNGFFYVHYSDSSGDTQISRFSVDAGNPDIADPSSEFEILNVDQPLSNHNGGTIAFGPDGYLYIALGDGGGGGDTDNNAQNLLLLLGKILRIDIDSTDGVNNYVIPPDNPFVGDPNALDEIWAYGLRNPFRFSIDFEDEKIWIGDVGQNAREEVNSVSISEAGLNYGWRCYEGNDPFNTVDCPPMNELTFPVYDYPWSGGGSVIGGRVYRGSVYADLQNVYIFGDIDGMMGTLDESFNYTDQSVVAGTWVGFGEDITGEMYVVSLNGTLYKIKGGVLSTNSLEGNSFAIYPNPAIDKVSINSTGTEIQSIELFDITGKRVLQQEFEGNKAVEISVQTIHSGLYLLKVVNVEGLSEVSKLIIQ